ncbi:MAG: YkgJ family cysteine cluster protein [Deltaproteobacteria bacterium]|nr:YkgJ family cysteine cluster protein [Deltaproteobacteria bacterium]
MKVLDPEKAAKLPGKRLAPGESFRFECRPDLPCFGRCCRNLNLFLYPYDVARLRKALGISSAEFIDRYTHVVLRPGSFFPDVLLAMEENEEKTCPFLSGGACTVYADRPDACRTFPVEMGFFLDEQGNREEVAFFRPPDFCLGKDQEAEFTAASWMEDQNALVYHRMTLKWGELLSMITADPWRGEGPEGPRARMAFMAAYNPDEFRRFVKESTFLQRHKVPRDVVKKIRTDDTELLLLAMDWIRLFLLGVLSKRVKPAG